MNHLIENKGPWSITDFNLPNWALVRNIPRDWNRENVNIGSNLLHRFSMCAHQPILPRFSMTTYASIEQFARGAMMSAARQEKKIAPVIILQNKPNPGFCIIWRKVRNRSYHLVILHSACSIQHPYSNLIVN
jgi:hypothetical protein